MRKLRCHGLIQIKLKAERSLERCATPTFLTFRFDYSKSRFNFVPFGEEPLHTHETKEKNYATGISYFWYFESKQERLDSAMAKLYPNLCNCLKPS
jgi:hypothetical protein